MLREWCWLGLLGAQLSPVEPRGTTLTLALERSLPPLCWPPGPTALPMGHHWPYRSCSANAHEFQSLLFLLYRSEVGIGTKRSARPHSQKHTGYSWNPFSFVPPAKSDFSHLPKAKYIGCYLDDTQSRALRGVSFFDYKKMTIFRCQDNCAER